MLMVILKYLTKMVLKYLTLLSLVTLTANMGTGGHNVPLILAFDNRIRRLSPRECFNLQGFPKDYVLPELSNIHLYKQAGNSVVVSVIRRIAEAVIASGRLKWI